MPNITKYSRKTGDFQQHEVINQMSQWISILNYLTKYVPEYVTYFTLISQYCSIAFSVTQGPVLKQRSETGLDIKHLVYVPMVLKIYVPCKNFDVPNQYLYKPSKAYVYCWKNKYMPRLKNHLPSWARNHKCLCALGQDLHAPGTWARLNVKPCDTVTILSANGSAAFKESCSHWLKLLRQCHVAVVRQGPELVLWIITAITPAYCQHSAFPGYYRPVNILLPWKYATINKKICN